MSKLRITAAVAALIFAGSTPFAMAQTTLGGSAKDNHASGGKENGTAAGSGKGMAGSSMTKSGDAPAPSTTTENKQTMSGGQPGGDATRGR